jgi:hypothetical protein
MEQEELRAHSFHSTAVAPQTLKSRPKNSVGGLQNEHEKEENIALTLA